MTGGDALDRLVGVAGDLLARVDGTLAGFGAPADHPVWPLLSRLRTLPGEAVGALAAATAAPLATAGGVLRLLQREYAHARAALPAAPGWRGAGADAFAGQWGALGAHLDSASPDDLAGRLAATTSYVDDLAGWLAELRAAVARTLAVVVISAEAVRVRTAADPVAAADIAACLLATLADGWERGERLRGRCGTGLGELVYRAPDPPVLSRDAHTVVPL
ncbi:MAG TPA: hypothetical protein VFE14_16800 [Micromonosporaceae bacterium]|nr:hypothetical protein [Micromonosporaceae bacterium]